MTKVFLHCSDSPNPAQDISDVRSWHFARGWDDIGYNWFIKQNGIVQPGRDEKFVPAGVEGHNEESIHICLAGRDKFTAIQFEKLIALLKLKKLQYPQAELFGHCEYDTKGKTCPNFDVKPWRILWNSFPPSQPLP